MSRSSIARSSEKNMNERHNKLPNKETTMHLNTSNPVKSFQGWLPYQEHFIDFPPKYIKIPLSKSKMCNLKNEKKVTNFWDLLSALPTAE